MLKSKAVITRWANEIVRCEEILSNDNSTLLEVQQAEWKIQAIMMIYESDFEAVMILLDKIEQIISKKV